MWCFEGVGAFAGRLGGGEFFDGKHGVCIRQNGLFVPFDFDPRRVPDDEVEAAAIGKDVGEFEFPVHEFVLFGDARGEVESRAFASQSRYIDDRVDAIGGDDAFGESLFLGGE